MPRAWYQARVHQCHVARAERDRREIGPTKVLEDDQGAIMLSENHLSSARLKHIDVRYKHIQTQYAIGVFELVYILSSE